MNSESKPSSSTVRAKALMPRARSGPSPSQTYEGRKTPNRPTSLMCDPTSCKVASAAAVLGVALLEERRAPSSMSSVAKTRIRRVQLGGQAGVEVGLGRQVEQALRLAHRERAARGDLLADLGGPRDAPRRPARPRGRGRSARPPSASRTRPVRISSLARAAPTTRGRRCVPPAPGVTARRTSGSPSLARSEAMRRSQHSASSRPPPRALPSIAAIVGIGSSASRRATPDSSSCRSRPAGPRCASNSPTCEPAENARSPSPAHDDRPDVARRERPRGSPGPRRARAAGLAGHEVERRVDELQVGDPAELERDEPAHDGRPEVAARPIGPVA